MRKFPLILIKVKCSGAALALHAEVSGSIPDVGWHFSSDKNNRNNSSIKKTSLLFLASIYYFNLSSKRAS